MIIYANGPGFETNHKSNTGSDGKTYFERRDPTEFNMCRRLFCVVLYSIIYHILIFGIDFDAIEYWHLSIIADYSYRYLSPVPLEYETHGGEDVSFFIMHLSTSRDEKRGSNKQEIYTWNIYCYIVQVPIYAYGPGAHLFSGVHEQHAIPHLLYCAACFGPYHTECPCGKGILLLCNNHFCKQLNFIITVHDCYTSNLVM